MTETLFYSVGFKLKTFFNLISFDSLSFKIGFLILNLFPNDNTKSMFARTSFPTWIN